MVQFMQTSDNVIILDENVLRFKQYLFGLTKNNSIVYFLWTFASKQLSFTLHIKRLLGHAKRIFVIHTLVVKRKINIQFVESLLMVIYV